MNTRFQAIVTIVFIVLAVVGIIAFATLKSNSAESKITTEVWGTLPSNAFSQFLSTINQTRGNSPLKIAYTFKDEDTFEKTLVDALARGEGPDAVIVSQDFLSRQKDKIYPITFSIYPERLFKDTFVEAGEIFLAPEGVLAFPIGLDPLVLYWNRDSYTGAGVSQVPKYWDTFFSLASRMTVFDTLGGITKSAIGLGEFQNIRHASDIFTMLVMQAGGSITRYDAQGPRTISTLDNQSSLGTVIPASAALKFYTSFANPDDNAYSWNRSLPLSDEAFVAGDSATYIGFLSEFADIRAKNPNLNFDVAVMPQSRVGRTSTYANIYGIAILKRSAYPQVTYNNIQDMLSLSNMTEWTKAVKLPPVRRDLVQIPQTDAINAVGYASSVISKTWTNPDRVGADKVFRTMIESVLTGRAKIDEAVQRASKELQNLFDQN